MKRFILVLLALTQLNLSQAQSIFKVSADQNNRDMNECKANHNIILNRYRYNIGTEIARLANGIQIEKSNKTSKLTIGQYENLLARLVAKKIIVDSIYEQFNKKLKTYEGPGFFGGKIIDSDNLKIDIQKNFGKVLDKAIEQHNEESKISTIVLDTIKEEIINDAIKQLAKNTFTSLGNGLVAKMFGMSFVEASGITSALSTTTLVSFGSHVLKGAAVGAVLTLVTRPLMGARNPPEYDWAQLASKYPEMIIDPEWMNQAGINDAAWPTHCFAILRKTKQMEGVLKKLLRQEETEFMYSVRKIHQAEIDSKKENDPYLTRKEPADALYVAPVYSTELIETPYWALKK